MSTKKNNISDNLRLLRKLHDITVKKLHEKIGIEENTLRKYETDLKMPSLENLIKIASFFDISLDFLIYWDDCKYIRNKKLLLLAERIDKVGTNEKYKIEITSETLLKKSKNDYSCYDTENTNCSANINQNIKEIRTAKALSQKELATVLNLTPASITQYEKSVTPTTQNIIKIADYFNISLHYLVTGEKLSFTFIDKAFENTILKADKLLPLEDQKFIIKLMTRIIEDQ